MRAAEVELLKLSEILKRGQAAAHLGAAEAEELKLSENLKIGKAAMHSSLVQI